MWCKPANRARSRLGMSTTPNHIQVVKCNRIEGCMGKSCVLVGQLKSRKLANLVVSSLRLYTHEGLIHGRNKPANRASMSV
jgi:hypothetical protein